MSRTVGAFFNNNSYLTGQQLISPGEQRRLLNQCFGYSFTDFMLGEDAHPYDRCKGPLTQIESRDLLISTTAQALLFTLPCALYLGYFTRKPVTLSIPFRSALITGIAIGCLAHAAKRIFAHLNEIRLNNVGYFEDWKDYCEQLAAYTPEYRKKVILQSLKMIALKQAAFFLLYRYAPKAALTFTIGTYGFSLGVTITQVAFHNIPILISSFQKKDNF